MEFFRLIADQLDMKTSIVIGLTWAIIFIANYIAKQTPNKTDNRLLKLLRKLMRSVGAEPPTKDK